VVFDEKNGLETLGIIGKHKACVCLSSQKLEFSGLVLW